MRVDEVFRATFLTSYFLASAAISHLLGGGIFQVSARHFLLLPMAVLLSLATKTIKSKELLDLVYLIFLIFFQLITHMVLPYNVGTSDNQMFTAHAVAVVIGYWAEKNFDDLVSYIYSLLQSISLLYRFPAPFTPSKTQRFVSSFSGRKFYNRFIDREYSGLAPPFLLSL